MKHRLFDLSDLFNILEFSPPQIFVGSFFALIVVGTVALKTVPWFYYDAPPGWLDALFTATSAVSVTGLVVENTSVAFTPAGQAFLLLLIQLGGFGMITFTTLIILVIGKRVSLRQEMVVSSGTEVAPHVNYKKLTRDIFLFTFLIELAGAILLWFAWKEKLGYQGAIWPAVFHSVSAFCNAGFSIFPDSLIGYQNSPVTLGIIMVLIILGGMGFLTLEELTIFTKSQKERRTRGLRFSLHSRLVLAVTAFLIPAGAASFLAFEWSRSFQDLSVFDKIVNAFFLSVTPRTAGFNTIDYSAASESTNFLTIILMSIGGSPGSMAGGLKTTTAVLIGLLAWTRLRGETITSIWSRSIPVETTQRAVGLFVLAFGLVTASIFILILTEIGSSSEGDSPFTFLHFMFESVSAFNTVGLSMGPTEDLSPTGKALLTLMMFIGRVGPLTFSAALILRSRKVASGFRYAYEDVILG